MTGTRLLRHGTPSPDVTQMKTLILAAVAALCAVPTALADDSGPHVIVNIEQGFVNCQTAHFDVEDIIRNLVGPSLYTGTDIWTDDCQGQVEYDGRTYRARCATISVPQVSVDTYCTVTIDTA